jgi:iron complex outermembrane receptor protein
VLRSLGLALLLFVAAFQAAARGDAAPADDDLREPAASAQPQLAIVGRPTPADEQLRKSAVRDVLAPSDPVTPASDLQDIVTTLPGVGANGQGGLLQGYSIRGLGRQRTLTVVGGVPIVSDRRAGASGSFLDPTLMGGVQVRRGPASAEYGSGALGGVVDASPRFFEGPAASFGYQSGSDEYYGMAGTGNERSSLGLSYRKAHDDEEPDGSRLFSRFEQWSVALQRRWDLGERDLEVMAIQSMARDVGKANSDYPTRTTIYPDERHLVASATLRSRDDWLVRAFAHPNSLDTEVKEAGSTSRVKSDALDLGVHAVRWLHLGGGARAQAGIDYLGRRGVDSREAGVLLLEDAAQDEAALFASVSAPLGRANLAMGGRFTGFRQRNTGSGADNEWQGDGFLGGSMSFARGLTTSLELSTGTRFPTLGERFFSGTTGRGTVIANPNLDPERAYSGDFGLRWEHRQGGLELHSFHTRVRRYIERIETAPDVLTFTNLHSGTIRGVEGQGSLHLGAHWTAYVRGHALDGESDDGAHLADIPPDELSLGLRYRGRGWGARAEYTYRRSKNDVGSSEQSLDSAELVEASLWLRVSKLIVLTVGTENLTDEKYFASADRKAPLAPGRLLFIRFDLSR